MRTNHEDICFFTRCILNTIGGREHCVGGDVLFLPHLERQGVDESGTEAEGVGYRSGVD
jgi:hypothetical protein